MPNYLRCRKKVFQHLNASWDALPLPISKLLLKTGLKDVSSQSCIILRILQQVESILKQPNVETNNYQCRFVLRATPQPYNFIFILANTHRFSSFDGHFRLAKFPRPAALKRLQTEWGSKKPYSCIYSTSLRMLYYANNRKRNSDTDICGGFSALSFLFSELDKQACNTLYIRPYSHNCSINLRILWQVKPLNPMLKRSIYRPKSVNKVYKILFPYI